MVFCSGCAIMLALTGAGLSEIIGTLRKTRRQRQRERHQTKGLMSRRIAVHVHYKSLYYSLQWREEGEIMSDVRSETCAVDCVFYSRAFRGSCERSISSNSPAHLKIKDAIN